MLKLKKLNYKKIGFVIILSIVLSLLLETYIILLENSSIFYLLPTLVGLQTIPVYFSIKQFLVIFVLFLIITYILTDNDLRQKTLHFLYKYRLLLGIIILIICVIFQIHGSSIVKQNLAASKHNPLLGIGRYIKSDEYAISTPYALSQYYNNFSYFSDIIRSTTTDMFIVYGQPVWDLAVIFRPFHWGYLFLAPGQGLSFYWISRVIVLFLISFEFGMLITKKNKILSLIYTILIVLSPAVQWWIAINFLVEMLVFGQLIILLTNYYMNTDNYKHRLICSLIMVICVGGFLFALYPAWQVPLAYVFLGIFLWVVYKNRVNFKFNKKDGVLFLLFLTIISILVYNVLIKSYDTILIQMNTIYPGLRRFNGGADIYWLSGDLSILCDYPRTLFYPLTAEELGAKISLSYFISFFPLGIILYIYATFKQKKKDLLINILVIVLIGFMLYYSITFPEIVGTITLLSKTMTTRFFIIITFLNLLILIRAITILDRIKYPNILGTFKISKIKGLSRFSLVLGFLLTGLVLIIGYSNLGARFYTKLMLVICLIVFGITFFFILNSGKCKKAQIGFLICVIFISISAGALVNPIESGLDYYYDQPLVSTAATIVPQDPNATWIIEGEALQGDLVAPVGAHTLNSVNTYPNFELWSALDPDNEQKDIWNRYAHLKINLNDTQPTNMKIPEDKGIVLDRIILNLSVNDMEKLNISYVISSRPLDNLNNDNVTFTQIFTDNGIFIYHITYEKTT